MRNVKIRRTFAGGGRYHSRVRDARCPGRARAARPTRRKRSPTFFLSDRSLDRMVFPSRDLAATAPSLGRPPRATPGGVPPMCGPCSTFSPKAFSASLPRPPAPRATRRSSRPPSSALRARAAWNFPRVRTCDRARRRCTAARSPPPSLDSNTAIERIWPARWRISSTPWRRAFATKRASTWWCRSRCIAVAFVSAGTTKRLSSPARLPRVLGGPAMHERWCGT